MILNTAPAKLTDVNILGFSFKIKIFIIPATRRFWLKDYINIHYTAESA